MIDLRRLAAIDIAILGHRLIVAEYTFGVLFSIALGVFVLMRGHSGWQILLGVYLVCLGINYAPMLGWAVAIGNRANACAELGDELRDKPAAMARYRKVSLILLVPVAPVVVTALRRRFGRRRAAR